MMSKIVHHSHRLFHLSLCLGLLLLVNCRNSSGSEEPGSPLSKADRAAIEALLHGYTEAWQEGIPEKVLALFSEDAVILPHHGVQPKEGVAQMRDFWWPPAQDSSFAVERFVIELREVSGQGGLAYAWGRFQLRYRVETGGERTIFNSEGNHFSVLTQLPSGEWRIHRSIWNDPIPEQQ